MNIIHNLHDKSVSRRTEGDAGFMLSNKKGSYCSFFSRPLSKYNGLFLFDPSSMFMHKTIEHIEIEGAEEADELTNNFYFFERSRKGFNESFFMPSGLNSLLYELDDPARINLFLDFREAYDNREWGRNYQINAESGIILVHFTKLTDNREDSTGGKDEYSIYLALKSDFENYEFVDEWVERDYDIDKQRNSQSKRFVYKAIAMHGTRFAFSMSKNKADAIRECKYSFSNFEKLKKDEEFYAEKMLHDFGIGQILEKNIPDETKIAYVNAVNSLNNLIVHDEFQPGLIAGFPWFFQYWSRDTLVSLSQIMRINHSIGAKILHDYLNSINSEGRLPNLIGQFIGSPNSTSDAHGWLFARCHQICHKIEQHKDISHSISKITSSLKKSNPDAKTAGYILNADSVSEREFYNAHRLEGEIEFCLERSISRLQKFRTADCLESNSELETWMDSAHENDTRTGFRIEMQALRLNMYRLMFEITRDNKYKSLENMMLSKVLQTFWNGNSLADGMGDFTARPNVFIAAYVYRHLLSNEDWEKCFDNIIPKLWLDWGGFSTIDKSHHLFVDYDTGEDSRSYHRGNSWFWINNMAAIVLHKLNKEKYSDKIQKIVSASADEILWKGCIGCHSEISDAKELSSKGCFSQAWSNAMFIEMVDEVFSLS